MNSLALSAVLGLNAAPTVMSRLREELKSWCDRSGELRRSSSCVGTRSMSVMRYFSIASIISAARGVGSRTTVAPCIIAPPNGSLIRHGVADGCHEGADVAWQHLLGARADGREEAVVGRERPWEPPLCPRWEDNGDVVGIGPEPGQIIGRVVGQGNAFKEVLERASAVGQRLPVLDHYEILQVLCLPADFPMILKSRLPSLAGTSQPTGSARRKKWKIS